MDSVQVYLCDPEKNVECCKMICKHNPQANTHWPCETTCNRAYAKLDGNGDPITMDIFGAPPEEGVCDDY